MTRVLGVRGRTGQRARMGDEIDGNALGQGDGLIQEVPFAVV